MKDSQEIAKEIRRKAKRVSPDGDSYAPPNSNHDRKTDDFLSQDDEGSLFEDYSLDNTTSKDELLPENDNKKKDRMDRIMRRK